MLKNKKLKIKNLKYLVITGMSGAVTNLEKTNYDFNVGLGSEIKI